MTKLLIKQLIVITNVYEGDTTTQVVDRLHDAGCRIWDAGLIEKDPMVRKSYNDIIGREFATVELITLNNPTNGMPND